MGDNITQERNKVTIYAGSCLCGETAYMANGEPVNPHLCSCKMCQKSSGALTVAWVDFSLQGFTWIKKIPNLYQSSEKTQRLSCKTCGGLLGAIDKGCDTIGITIASLEHPNLIIPNAKHSYKEHAPSWWKIQVIN